MVEMRILLVATAVAGGLLGWPVAMAPAGPEQETGAAESAVSDAADVASVLMGGITATGVD